TTTLPTLVRTPTLMMQPSLDIKPFMSFPVDSSSAVGFFPNFNTMDPVQKAVINHTFGVSIPPKKKQVISCNVCQLRFNSDVSIAYVPSFFFFFCFVTLGIINLNLFSPNNSFLFCLHSEPEGLLFCPLRGGKDKGKAKPNSASQQSNTEMDPFLPKPGVAAVAPAAPASSSKSTNGAASTVIESEEEKAKKLLYCSLCKVAVNSLSQLEAHNTGSKHKTMVEARNGAGPIKSYPRPGSRMKVQNGSKGSGLQNKTFHCEICDVHVNSEIQLKQHISSRRHKDRVAGKPMKPKYSPYNKLQRNPSILAAKLAFQKDMIKPLAPAFLSSPLAAAAAVSSALSLPPRPSASLFQAPAIPPALLRPAHGPIRATPASILFAPY
ncbi:Z385B protein, partial [Mystacornis crossleyi]|nr:Z385B protein [Mystacornis crossleyi]